MGVIYTAETTVEGGRSGRARSSDGKLDVVLSSPGSRDPGTNPEQMLAAGYSACFLSAVEWHGERAGIDVEDPRIDATVELVEENGDYFLRARLDVSAAAVSDAQLGEPVRKAHETCPYSKTTRGNIDVTLAVNGRPLEGD